MDIILNSSSTHYMAVGQNPVPPTNIKIGGTWMFIHVHPPQNG